MMHEGTAAVLLGQHLAESPCEDTQQSTQRRARQLCAPCAPPCRDTLPRHLAEHILQRQKRNCKAAASVTPPRTDRHLADTRSRAAAPVGPYLAETTACGRCVVVQTTSGVPHCAAHRSETHALRHHASQGRHHPMRLQRGAWGSLPVALDLLLLLLLGARCLPVVGGTDGGASKGLTYGSRPAVALEVLLLGLHCSGAAVAAAVAAVGGADGGACEGLTQGSAERLGLGLLPERGDTGLMLLPERIDVLLLIQTLGRQSERRGVLGRQHFCSLPGFMDRTC
eukprot:507742-Pelagomonas_calceolata.AAC.9